MKTLKAKLLTGTLAILLVTALPLERAQALNLAGFCKLIFGQGTVEKPLDEARRTRPGIVSHLRETPEIPAFVKKTANGDLPVILVTPKTYPLLKSVLDRSMGTMFVQQVGYNNDHGLMRVGPYIIDVDLPGHRGYGEINATGLAWKHMDSYIPRRNTEYNMVEVGFLLSKTEYETSLYYQLIRRAAIIRVPFTFGGHEPDMTQPNTVRGGEHCFIFCKGSAISGHVHEIKREMSGMGIKDVDSFMQKEIVKTFLKDARTKLLNTRFDDTANLNWSAVNQGAMVEALRAELPQGLKDQDRAILINWIVGLDASIGYQSLRREIGITDDGGFGDMRSPRASYVLVYAKDADAARFRDASFESPGVFYSWTADNQEAITMAPNRK